MTEPQTQSGHPFATNPAFQQWSEGQGQGFDFVYAGQGDGVWKFTPEEWWRFVTTTIHNNGAVILPWSKKIADLGGYSGGTSRYVEVLYWTLQDWRNELVPP